MNANDKMLKLVESNDGGPTDNYQSGEPIVIPLTKFLNDRAFSGYSFLSCCECGFRHMYTYSVFIVPSGKPYLTMKAYADEKTRPYKVVRNEPRRSKKARKK